MHATSRRRFLELAGLGAAAAAIGPRGAGAQGKSLTLLHETSFIPPFDEYMQKTLAPSLPQADLKRSASFLVPSLSKGPRG